MVQQKNNSDLTPTVYVHPVKDKIYPVSDPSQEYWALYIDPCPWCGHFHSHGGGSTDHEPETGKRLAHCRVSGAPTEYELIALPYDPEYIPPHHRKRRRSK